MHACVLAVPVKLEISAFLFACAGWICFIQMVLLCCCIYVLHANSSVWEDSQVLLFVICIDVRVYYLSYLDGRNPPS